jgi:hypothetical protein
MTRKDVYTVVERKNKTFWTRIGAAFENRDGSLSVVLDALPVDGKLQIRDHVAREQHPEQRAEQPAAGRQEPNDYDIPFCQ